MGFYTKLAYYILVLFLLWGSFRIIHSNSVSLMLVNCTDSDLATLAMLDKKVLTNFLYRDYYEVSSYSPLGPCRIADYDKERELLRVCNDPGSGWAGFFRVSEVELHQLVLRNARFDDLRRLCKPYPYKDL